MNSILRYSIIVTLTILARVTLFRRKPFVIVVAGSVGKTSTKDAIFHVLKESGDVRKSDKSFNSEIGIPLTILGLENAWRSPMGWLRNIAKAFFVACSTRSYPKTLVLEVGSDHPGDIKRLAKWLSSDIAVLTSLPEVPVHVEYFSSPEALRDEDAQILLSLKKGGIFVGNADDPFVRALLSDKERNGMRTVGYGFGKEAHVRGMFPTVRYAKNEGVSAPVGMQFSVKDSEMSRPVYLDRVLGTPSCLSVLAAIAVAIARGEALNKAVEAMMTYNAPPGRMRLIDGKAGSMIIDDSYNSSPIALSRALETLTHLQCGRKIALLGDMLELGDYTLDTHWQAGREAGAFLDLLITVGKRARLIAEGAKSAGLPEGRIHMCATSEEAGELMLGELQMGDVMLVKGSQGSGENAIRMERAVKMLMAHPDKASELLVRQEVQWKAR